MRTLILTGSMMIMMAACGSRTDLKKEMAGSEKIPVSLIPVRSSNQETLIHTSGILGTENEAKLSFKTGGIIEEVWVKEGDKVRKGQLLATLRPTEINAQVQQVELALEKAQRDYQRTMHLYHDSVATLEQYQNARTSVDIARQSLQQAAFNRQYSRIYAPADGFISRKLANPGEVVASGAPVLIIQAVSGNSRWILRCGLADKEWAALETGNPARINLDAFPGKTFNGSVIRKGLSADPASGSFPVEIQVNFDTEQPAAGLYGTAAVGASRPVTGFPVPYEALLEINGLTGYVFVSDDRTHVKRVPVMIASINQEVAWISSGLEGHAFIVTNGSPYLSENSTITVQP